MGSMVTWVILGVGCVYDLNDKKIPLFLIICGALGGGMFAWRNEMPLEELILAILPGIGFLLMGFLTGEKIGYGDGMMIMVLGLLEGGGICLWDVGVGLLILTIFVTVLLIIKKADRNTMVPMMPFLFAAHVINSFVRG